MEEEISVKASNKYQLQVNASSITEGICNYDLYAFEKVTYSPATKLNTPICDYSIEMKGSDAIFEAVNNPWYKYFTEGCDGEYMKIAISDMVRKDVFNREIFCGTKMINKGQLVFSEVKLLDVDKIKRIYTRLISNLGAKVNTELLTYVKEEKDLGIPTFMLLPYDKKNQYKEEEAYFTDKNYLLNNLGEGVYGWMKRIEKQEGFITIPDSSGKTYFLTLFINSEINRDPEKRASGELPDSSIVPDLYVNINSDYKLFVNGQCFADVTKENHTEALQMKIDDVILQKGINRLCVICSGGKEDIKFNMYFKNKYGDAVEGLKYVLTLD